MPVHIVSSAELRRLFNESGYPERARSGENMLVTPTRRGNPAPEYHQPPGTISETALYSESRGNRLVIVAMTHAFILPDGRINNPLGLPDPKYLRIGEDIYKLPRGQ